MPSFEDLAGELDKLIDQGRLLLYAMAKDLDLMAKSELAKIDAAKIKLPVFTDAYDRWYSVAVRVVAQVIPDRLEDFVLQYKQPKRKEVDYLTYTISDYLLGVTTRFAGEIVADSKAALPKMKRQLAILESAESAFQSKLVDLREVLQADLFDSELSSASGLNKSGFVRAGGAVAGVVLEKHLRHVCEFHKIKITKKHPSINDLNQLLKDAEVIDTAKWRFIQHLGDLRNLCDHAKEREPTKDDAAELIEGVAKVIKTVT